MKTPECLLAYAEELEQYYARHYPPLAPLAKPCFLSTVQTTSGCKRPVHSRISGVVG